MGTKNVIKLASLELASLVLNSSFAHEINPVISKPQLYFKILLQFLLFLKLNSEYMQILQTN
jgi:hypothetical protein